METIRFSLIGREDIRFGTGTFEVTLADGRVAVLTEVDLAAILNNQDPKLHSPLLFQLSSYTRALLPAAGTVGRLVRVADDVRGVWMDQGSLWFPLSGGIINVREFGATGDGVTDDAPAFAAAITAAAGTLCILVPPGTYKIVGALANLTTASFITFGTVTITGTNADALGYQIAIGGGNDQIRFMPFGGIANTPAKLALMPVGTGQANGVRTEFRAYMNATPGDNVNLEAHNDGDGNQRYRIATRIGTGGTHFPFYWQIAGFNTLYIDTTGVIVTRDKSGASDWQVAGAARGDLVLGANGNTIWAVNSGGTLYNIIGSDTANRVRLDTGGGTLVAGTTPTVLTNAAGQLVSPAIAAATYSAGATTPSVLNASYLEIANSGPTTITNFTNGRTGQILTLKFADANTTITRANARLAAGANFTSATNAVLVLVLDSGGIWNEVSRATTNS